jgi:hypothetical protein
MERQTATKMEQAWDGVLPVADNNIIRSIVSDITLTQDY